MATTLYCDARNGNDSASGTTWAAAFKTLGAAMAVVTDGSTVNCCGAFNESLVYNLAKGNITFSASGFAVLDGLGAIANGITNTGTQGSNKRLTLVDFHIRNFTAYGMYILANAAFTYVTLTRCRVESCPIGCAFSGAGWGADITANDCVFANCVTAGVLVGFVSGVQSSSCSPNHCTFVNNGVGIKLAASLYCYVLDVNYNIFSNNTYNILFGAVSRYLNGGNNNNWNFANGEINYKGANYTSLSTWKAAVTPFDANSISVDPAFVDSAKGCYRLQKTTPAILNGIILGAFKTLLAEGCSHNYNEPTWSGAVVAPAGSCYLDGSDNWVLSGTCASGTVTFEFGFGTPRSVRKINLQHNYAGLGAGTGGGPTSILDFDKADTLPETWEYRVAVDTGGGYGAFADKNLFNDLNLTGVVNLKVEATLRSDG